MIIRIALVVSILLLMIQACIPAPTLIPVSSATVPATLTALSTNTLTSTQSLTGTPTLTATTRPSETPSPVLTLTFSAPLATVPATRTRSALPTSTQTQTISPIATPTATTHLQATGTAPPPTPFCPIATAEPFWVDPVTSPTEELSQVIVVRIGNGEEVAVVTESGTFTVTGNFGTFLVEISLLPNTEHHLEVFAKVRTVPAGNGCIYGGYTLTTTRDSQGAPLTIVQVEPTP